MVFRVSVSVMTLKSSLVSLFISNLKGASSERFWKTFFTLIISTAKKTEERQLWSRNYKGAGNAELSERVSSLFLSLYLLLKQHYCLYVRRAERGKGEWMDRGCVVMKRAKERKKETYWGDTRTWRTDFEDIFKGGANTGGRRGRTERKWRLY